MNRIIINNKQYPIEIAISDEEKIQGLMYKSWPPPIMAFPYNDLKQRKFWMKNTISPLDIVFSKRGKIIDIVNGKPLCLDNIGPDEECDLIVEFPAGMVVANNINIGDKIKLSYSIQTLANKFAVQLR